LLTDRRSLKSSEVAQSSQIYSQSILPGNRFRVKHATSFL